MVCLGKQMILTASNLRIILLLTKVDEIYSDIWWVSLD